MIHGPIDSDLLNSHPVAFALGERGRQTAKAGWQNLEGSLAEFLLGFPTEHRVGATDGPAITLGTCTGGTRTSAAMEKMALIGLNLDTGEDAAMIDARVRELGWFCAVKAEWNLLRSAEVKFPSWRFRRSAGISDRLSRSWAAAPGAWAVAAA